MARREASNPQDEHHTAWDREQIAYLPMQDGTGDQSESPARYNTDNCLHTGQASNLGTPRLDGINTHTSGTEFYGGSSNLAFLARLFSKARKRATTLSHNEEFAAAGNEAPLSRDASSELLHINDKQSSLVDLMYSTDYHSPADRARIPDQGSKDTFRATIASSDDRLSQPEPSQRSSDASAPEAPTSTPALRYMPSAILPQERFESHCATQVEEVFIEAYFINMHYIHPILDKKTFKAQCARRLQPTQSKPPPSGCQSQFLALYYAVVALGAINSGVDQTSSLARYYQSPARGERHGTSTERTSLEWASLYFMLAKRALGDMMEISSLESCQALFLMVGLLCSIE